jgi:hypothetical protein
MLSDAFGSNFTSPDDFWRHAADLLGTDEGAYEVAASMVGKPADRPEVPDGPARIIADAIVSSCRQHCRTNTWGGKHDPSDCPPDLRSRGVPIANGIRLTVDGVLKGVEVGKLLLPNGGTVFTVRGKPNPNVAFAAADMQTMLQCANAISDALAALSYALSGLDQAEQDRTMFQMPDFQQVLALGKHVGVFDNAVGEAYLQNLQTLWERGQVEGSSLGTWAFVNFGTADFEAQIHKRASTHAWWGGAT